MNTTLDSTRVTSQVDKDFIALALSLGYTIVTSEKEEGVIASAPGPNSIPTLYSIDVPLGATIASASADIPMSDYCKQNLTNENFGTELSACPIRGGFHNMGKVFESSDAVAAIEELGRKTGKNFRVGTPLELLLFCFQNRACCPRYFVALGKKWNGRVLYWYGGDAKFYLHHWGGEWGRYCQVFFLEVLEPSATQS